MNFELASTTPPSPPWDRDGKTSYAILLVARQQLTIAGWSNGKTALCKSAVEGSIPSLASNFSGAVLTITRHLERVPADGLGTNLATTPLTPGAGATPVPGETSPQGKRKDSNEVQANNHGHQ